MSISRTLPGVGAGAPASGGVRAEARGGTSGETRVRGLERGGPADRDEGGDGWAADDDDGWDYVPSPVTQAQVAVAAAAAAWQLEELNQLVGMEGDRWGATGDEGCAPGEQLASGWAATLAGARRAVLTREGAVGLAEADLVTGMASGAQALSGVLTGLFVLVREGIARQLHLDVGMGAHDWARARCPGLAAETVNDMVALARAANRPGTDELADAVATGTVPVHRGAVVARTMERLRSSLLPEEQVAYARIATRAAADETITDKELRVQVCGTLIVDLLEQRPKDDDGDRGAVARELRFLSRRPIGDGLTRYTLDAPDEDAALIDGIINGPLAAPAPDNGEFGGMGDAAAATQIDERSAGQRRYDAMITVLNRGLGHPGAAPSASRASVIITVKADPATGRPTGAAFSQTGQAFSAEMAGLFACKGDLTPIVLGPLGEPLDLGRTVRLATKGQFKALLVRDRHCTFPGCSIPATWCDAHHVRWWSRHGDTDIDNLALLCPRHHTLVHSKDLAATVSGGCVTWHV